MKQTHSFALYCPINGSKLRLANETELQSLNAWLEKTHHETSHLTLPDDSSLPLPLTQAYLSANATHAYPVSPHGIPILIPEAAINMEKNLT